MNRKTGAGRGLVGVFRGGLVQIVIVNRGTLTSIKIVGALRSPAPRSLKCIGSLFVFIVFSLFIKTIT